LYKFGLPDLFQLTLLHLHILLPPFNSSILEPDLHLQSINLFSISRSTRKIVQDRNVLEKTLPNNIFTGQNENEPNDTGENKMVMVIRTIFALRFLYVPEKEVIRVRDLTKQDKKKGRRQNSRGQNFKQQNFMEQNDLS
jgi:hypothetical protein